MRYKCSEERAMHYKCSVERTICMGGVSVGNAVNITDWSGRRPGTE